MKRLYKQLIEHSLLTLSLLIILTSCSSDHDDNTLSITSYNMGLARNFVPYTQERLEANKSLISEIDSDVICFQEVWLQEHVDAVIAATEDNFPFTYTVEPQQIFSEEAACTNEEVQGFADCANSLCEGLSGSALVACAPSQCGSFLGSLSPTCVDGVVGGVGLENITVQTLLDLVTQPAGRFAFDGSLGLIITSKYPLQNTEFQDFIEDSSSNHRGALYAEIIRKKKTRVIGCTHPTANLSETIGYPPSGKHDSWEGENLFQQQQMIAFVNSKAGGNPIYFAGDFNCSIANESYGVEEDFSASCRLWLDNGFEDPAADQLACSFCSDENLILSSQQTSGGGGGEGDLLLDHIFVKNLDNGSAISAKRIYDDPVEILALDPEQELSLEESPLYTHPSDHFGVHLDIPL